MPTNEAVAVDLLQRRLAAYEANMVALSRLLQLWNLAVQCNFSNPSASGFAASVL